MLGNLASFTLLNFALFIGTMLASCSLHCIYTCMHGSSHLVLVACWKYLSTLEVSLAFVSNLSYPSGLFPLVSFGYPLLDLELFASGFARCT
ncbi:hypothetical protein C8R43DRAFT_1010753, partial [Mycena crocata]